MNVNIGFLPPPDTSTLWWVGALFAGLIGLVIGSFLNVVIGRVPAGETIMGTSKCPACSYHIKPYDNIPLLSWLILRGKCRNCHNAISWQYPAVELFTAASFLGIYLWQTPTTTHQAGETLFWWNVAATTIALAVIDLKTGLLPAPVAYWFSGSVTVTALLLWYTNPAPSGTFTTPTILSGVTAGVTYLAIYFALFYFGQMGWGDVRISPIVGFLTGMFGYGTAAIGWFLPFLLGAVTVTPLLLTSKLRSKDGEPRTTRKTKIPFGPFIFAGMWIAILYGQNILDWWLGLFLP